MVNTIKDFAELLTKGAFNDENEMLNVIEANDWYDLTIEDCLDKECTLHSVCSDGKDMIIFNSYTETYSIIPDREKREKCESVVFHKEKVTDVNFKSITGHDICVRVKRVFEPGYDVSFLEMSIDGGKFYTNVSSGTYKEQTYYEVYDKEQDKSIKVIIPDDVYCNIMFLQGESIVETSGMMNDILLREVKEFVKEGLVMPKAQIIAEAKRQGLNNVFFHLCREESEISTLRVLDRLQGAFAKGLNGNYRGYMIAEYVEVIKKLYPNEFKN